MNFDLLEKDLSTVLAEGCLVAAEADRTFGRLSARQVNWKSSEAEWSIGRIVVVHEQNHFVQARRVRESAGFPVA